MNNLSNIVVYIKDEDMLEEVKEMLDKYDEPFTKHPLFCGLLKHDSYNYLAKDDTNWHIGCKSDVRHTEITLTELEQLLKLTKDV